MPTFVDPPILGGSCMNISANFQHRIRPSGDFIDRTNVAISQAACRAITLSTFADSRLSCLDASADVAVPVRVCQARKEKSGFLPDCCAGVVVCVVACFVCSSMVLCVLT
jgi:hypothetical protein